MHFTSALLPLFLSAAVLGAAITPRASPFIPGAAHGLDCSGTSLFDRLPSDFEPSDLAFDQASSTLYIVSDEGTLGALTHIDADSGPGAKIYSVGKDYDLEGCTFVPSRPGFVYLGNEYPAAIVEYELASGQVTRKWEVQSFFEASPAASGSDEDTNSGLEALAFRQLNASVATFYVGRQSDARIFVVDVLLEGKTEKAPKFVGTLNPPGPGTDLASMTIFRDLLWLLFDKPKKAVALPLSAAVIPANATETVDATGLGSPEVGTLKFKTRGQEGLAFVELADGQKFAFVAVDPPKGKGAQDLVRYDFDRFFECFSRNGAPAALMISA
ncbi:hypothetical protein HDU86_004865 [Geranomyces michiganensis]|nr:hypothetical protein HDU86_004865 [Geranomyces michiganensis]